MQGRDRNSREETDMRKYCRNIGDHGEEFAAGVLTDKGYSIIDRNYRTKVGEIDIIAVKDGVLHFIEVKTRTDDECGYPADAVTARKQSTIRRAAECYLAGRHSMWRNISFDVMEVTSNLIEDCI